MRAHVAAAAVTAAFAAALKTKPLSQHASAAHAVIANVKRWPGAAWCRDMYSALFKYCVGSTFVQKLCVPLKGNSP